MKSIIVFLFILIAASAFAIVINVPGDYPTIQAGIDAADDGDTVLVADGTYTGEGNKDIDFLGKAILVASVNGPENCIIDCENEGRGFKFQNNETRESELRGFTITRGSISTVGGSYSYSGGGILCFPGSPTLKNCNIVNNSVEASGPNDNHGGGISILFQSGPKILNCNIVSNTADGDGGGFYINSYLHYKVEIIDCKISFNTSEGAGGIKCMVDDSIFVTGCEIVGNQATYPFAGYGGGINTINNKMMVTNCTIALNNASQGGGLWCSNYFQGKIENCIVYENNYGGMWLADSISNDCGVLYCLFNSNFGGNFTNAMPPILIHLIEENPLFVNPALGDFNLQPGSPCIDAGNPDSPLDPDRTLADIGAHYFDQSAMHSFEFDLTPTNPPVQIPANGGFFEFIVEFTNIGNTSPVVDVWTTATLPNGNIYGPCLGPVQIYLPPGSSITRNRIQTVPGNAPPGFYTYNGYLGIYPDVIWAEDHFDFEKLTVSDGGTEVQNWQCRGEGFVPMDKPDEILNSPFSILNCSPNPFNPSTTISFQLPIAGLVTISIYDITGRSVGVQNFEPIKKWMTAGSHQVVFDGSDLASGVYFARLQAGDLMQTEKLLLIK